MEQYHERVHMLQQNIQGLERTDIHQVPIIVTDLLSLSQDILRIDNNTLRDEFIPLIDDLYTSVMNKIDTFITLIEQ